MSDIFHEVDEEVRREQLKRMWDRYGLHIIAVALVIVLGIAGWRGYEWWEARKAAETGAAFEAAIALSEQGKHAEAEAAFAKIAGEAGAGYRALARLREAAELAQRDRKAAIAVYEQISTDSGVGQTLQDLATLRAGAILVDSASYDDVRRRLEGLTAAGRPFRHSAREFLALSAWRAGDNGAARQWVQLMMADPETPVGLRSRVEILAALVAAESKS